MCVLGGGVLLVFRVCLCTGTCLSLFVRGVPHRRIAYRPGAGSWERTAGSLCSAGGRPEFSLKGGGSEGGVGGGEAVGERPPPPPPQETLSC